jgi:histidine phosphotransfer protein HptB
MGQSLFDKQELLDRCLDDTEFAVEMLEIFAKQVPEQMAKLTTAMSQGQTQDAAKAAHAMKGTAGNLAAKRLHVAMAEIEKTLRLDDLDKAQQILSIVQREADGALGEVPAMIQQLKAA